MEKLTRLNVQCGKGFFSYGSREDLLENVKGIDTDPMINFAYTDYGGDVFEITCINFFSEKYPDNIMVEDTSYYGKNAMVYNTPNNPTLVQDFLEATDNYLLGFENIEETFQDVEDKFFDEFVNYVLTDSLRGYAFDKEKVSNWLYEEKSGYYNTTTQGIDFNESELIKELRKTGLINDIIIT